ncbi:putative very-long-chain -3-hydroxyacyl-CoA dehydratase [Golovinomyces cichoracearum]|uniref:Very-long-chain (3R)-3-hydroxyacyl-CoA dehydratase n=1 Tax=Golovinomyces cichoracearum TaxID=62708 RepID=A0A420IJG8_9PEZI|nr:putative very-long-chain -3-hydroxyacyl-CoA dehydratase [Golovinomyces cichoracearum]
MSTPDTKSQRGAKSSTDKSLRTQYLILYNFVSASLWFIILGRVLMLVPLVGFARIFDGIGKFTQMTQTLALLEIVHSAVGLVRAPISTTAMQVASRLLLVWGVLEPFPFVAKSPGYSSMLIAWSVTEVIRYSYFVFSLSGLNPGIITWFRYNTFYVLYPLGISSECWLLSKAISPAGKVHQAYAWIFQISLLIYIPGSYILFTHMITQRKKVLKAQKSA